MSYCRFSSDDFQSDVYAYASVGDFIAILVAGNRLVNPALRPAPLDPPDWWARGDEGIAAYMARDTKMREWIDAAEHVPIRLPHAGESFEEADEASAADRLEYLRGLGYNVPQRAIDALREEAKDTADISKQPEHESKMK